MRAMILAAGRGERMGAYTQATPKPLLKVAGRYLIDYSILSLTKIGIRDIIINVSYHREQIKAALGNGSTYGARFYFSEEPEALETGGGIFQALPLLGKDPFIVLSADVISEYALEKLVHIPVALAHLVLVNNPPYHPLGDFNLKNDLLYCSEKNAFTFGNIGVYHPDLFKDCVAGKFRLGVLLKKAIADKKVTGEYYSGFWHNIGTPTELNAINVALENRPGCLS